MWPDRHKVEYVLTDFRMGFRLGFYPESIKLKSTKAKCQSSLKHLSVIYDYLAKEVSFLGCVFGPTATPLANNLQIWRDSQERRWVTFKLSIYRFCSIIRPIDPDF